MFMWEVKVTLTEEVKKDQLEKAAWSMSTVGNFNASRPDKMTKEDTRVLSVDFESNSFVLLCRKPYTFEFSHHVKSLDYKEVEVV